MNTDTALELTFDISTVMHVIWAAITQASTADTNRIARLAGRDIAPRLSSYLAQSDAPYSPQVALGAWPQGIALSPATFDPTDLSDSSVRAFAYECNPNTFASERDRHIQTEFIDALRLARVALTEENHLRLHYDFESGAVEVARPAILLVGDQRQACDE